MRSKTKHVAARVVASSSYQGLVSLRNSNGEDVRPSLTLARFKHGDLVSIVPLLSDPREALAAKALADALEGLRSRYPSEPDRFCDHAAAPCHRCDAARAALRAAGRLP